MCRVVFIIIIRANDTYMKIRRGDANYGLIEIVVNARNPSIFYAEVVTWSVRHETAKDGG